MNSINIARYIRVSACVDSSAPDQRVGYSYDDQFVAELEAGKSW